MVQRKRTNNNQLDLFSDNDVAFVDPRFRLLKPVVRHDYSGDVGAEYPFVKSQEITIRPGVSIILGGRAQALMNILDFYAQNNRTYGIGEQRQISGSDFNTRYDRGAERVKAGSERIRDDRLRIFHEAVAYLAQQQELIDAGIIADDPDSTQDVTLQAGLNREFSGKASKYGKRRGRLAKKLLSQADVMGFSLTTQEDRRPIGRSK